jgi:predicted negative regulator of RcsB-dependent stress response
MNRIKVWPHAVLIALGVAILAAAGVFVWKRYEPSAAAKALPNAVRLERVQGQVAINRSLNSHTNTEWNAANANTPVSEGDRRSSER